MQSWFLHYFQLAELTNRPESFTAAGAGHGVRRARAAGSSSTHDTDDGDATALPSARGSILYDAVTS